MAAENRSASSVIAGLEKLALQPYAFDFYQAVRLIECAHPDKPRIGRAERPAEEAVRFKVRAHLDFAPAAIEACEPATESRPMAIFVRFFGLVGPNAPLPLHITEYVRERQRHHGDNAMAAFFDIFHHRLLSFFYRAWAAGKPTVDFDRKSEEGFARFVASLAGIGMPSLRHRDAMPDIAKMHFAAFLGAQSRPAEGLRRILEGLLKLPVVIVEFVGAWLTLPAEDVTRLGGSRESPRQAVLGRTAVAGERVWSRQDKFRVRLGPLSLPQYLRMLPGEEDLRVLVAAVRNYVGDALAWDVNLVLRAAEVPALQLGTSARLGWTSWLHRAGQSPDAADLELDAESMVRRLARGRR